MPPCFLEKVSTRGPRLRLNGQDFPMFGKFSLHNFFSSLDCCNCFVETYFLSWVRVVGGGGVGFFLRGFFRSIDFSRTSFFRTSFFQFCWRTCRGRTCKISGRSDQSFFAQFRHFQDLQFWAQISTLDNASVKQVETNSLESFASLVWNFSASYLLVFWKCPKIFEHFLATTIVEKSRFSGKESDFWNLIIWKNFFIFCQLSRWNSFQFTSGAFDKENRQRKKFLLGSHILNWTRLFEISVSLFSAITFRRFLCNCENKSSKQLGSVRFYRIYF